VTAWVWAIPQMISSRLIWASVLICATALLSSQTAQAQFSQDGNKLVGTHAVGDAAQGWSVALSADGATAIVGAPYDNTDAGAAWVFTRTGEVWTQQGGKLVGTVGIFAEEGFSVALSADGNTAIVGAPDAGHAAGAASVFIRSAGVWSQQGPVLVGTGAVGSALQGWSVALSADGNTAIVSGEADNSNIGAAWVYTRSKGVWTQQGGKLVGAGAVGTAQQGWSVALSADGDTAILGGMQDKNFTGAAWVFTRAAGVWTQQGGKLVGTGAVGREVEQGWSVALSTDGDTAIVGGIGDNSDVGAAWVFTRSNGVWTQQGAKLVGAGWVGPVVYQGESVSLSSDGDTAMVGASADNLGVGAAWVFTRNGVAWTQQVGKLIGAGAVGNAQQGHSVSLAGDGDTTILGGLFDNNAGAAWVFVQPLEVWPYTDFAASGAKGGPFSPSSFSYQLRATSGSVKYSITNVPKWLTASSASGTLTTANTTITFKTNAEADKLAWGTYTADIEFNNTTGKEQASIARTVTLTVKP